MREKRQFGKKKKFQTREKGGKEEEEGKEEGGEDGWNKGGKEVGRTA